ncbi:MAG: polysaccharide pyruvyl transferase family protein [Chlorogloeopsis fritschii C42_A2020_084]|uniref:polysaccharide pyruvyl transferase family protein n=1 Tax=Chlorogloeopsis fritschii TaxID=1124 RepID=UPI001A054BFC|nr:polysaccharide pyruvyl transferase family protein [Chlorogloeopsis fritschii]MBF2005176.1 polysaccharide pyruvyl transferase family protein [Chlorogloeopsis fritschii C42_A2020_084]
MKGRHAVITGSLQTGNVGDNALAQAFVNQQRKNYQKLTILGVPNQDLLSLSESIISPPTMAIGYRFWKGYQQRVQTQKIIKEQMPDARRHYIWLGGLLGANIYHLKSRYQELHWAFNFCHKLIYYFGDFEPDFNHSTVEKKLINKFNNSNVWIAVRSIEAADLLREAGLRQKIYVGVDAALYERYQWWGIPFKRRCKDVGAVAIILCHYRSEQYLPIWQAAAIAAIKMGMKILWISLCDREDMTLCKKMYQNFSEQYPHHPMEIISEVNGETKIAESSVCVATRFHAAIFGITSGVPTIAVPYGQKIKRLFQFLKLEEWIADPTLNSQKDVDWNFTIYEMFHAALEGKFQIDYTALESSLKAHKEALSDLDLFITN